MIARTRTWLEVAVVMVAFSGLVHGSTDPIAKDCQDLCRAEMEAEGVCATDSGCYDAHIVNDADLFLQCWTPCWAGPQKCLSTCRAKHAQVTSLCQGKCASNADPSGCFTFCFFVAMDRVIRGPPTLPSGPPTSGPSTGGGVPGEGPVGPGAQRPGSQPGAGPPGSGPALGDEAVGKDESGAGAPGATVLPPGDEAVDQDSAAANATVTPEAAVPTVDGDDLTGNATALN